MASLLKVPALQVMGNANCCVAQLYHGDITDAITSGETALALVTPETSQAIVQMVGMAPEAYISCYLSEALWMRGLPDQALRFCQRAVAAGRELNHGPSEEFAVGYQAMFFHLLRDPERILAVAHQTFQLGEQHRSVFWNPVIATYKGWALSAQGCDDEGIALMRDGLARYLEGGHGLSQVHMRTALAEALGKAKRWEEALATLAEAMSIATATGEAYFEPEAYRLRGEVMRVVAAEQHESALESRLEEAEASVREALMMARQQKAKSLELRAAMSLCRLQRDRGHVTDGSRLLTNLLGSFTEGFDTPDVRDARALVTELGN